MQKIQINQFKTEREEQNWKVDTTQLQDLHKVTIIINVVLVKEQTNIPLEQNRLVRNRPREIESDL